MSNKTDEMRALSQETALYRKILPKDPITGRWARRLHRPAEPYTTPRDRSLRGKARVQARKARNKMGW